MSKNITSHFEKTWSPRYSCAATGGARIALHIPILFLHVCYGMLNICVINLKCNTTCWHVVSNLSLFWDKISKHKSAFVAAKFVVMLLVTCCLILFVLVFYISVVCLLLKYLERQEFIQENKFVLLSLVTDSFYFNYFAVKMTTSQLHSYTFIYLIVGFKTLISIQSILKYHRDIRIKENKQVIQFCMIKAAII